MYFQLRVIEPAPDPHLSWILSKHPEHAFERNLANQPGVRVAVARFLPDGSYAGEVVNDSVEFLVALRKHNLASYVDVGLHAVCPQNLKGLAVTFRSALHGSRGDGSPLTEEEFWSPKRLVMEIGPFPRGRDRASAIFAEAGLAAEILDEGARIAYTLRISNPSPFPALSVTTFLQRVYLLSYYLTRRVGHHGEVNESQIDKFAALCAGWLPAMPSSQEIIRELCGFRRGAIGTFAASLAAEAADPEATPEIDSDGEPAIADPDGVDPAIQEALVDPEASIATTIADAGEKSLEDALSLHHRRHALILDVLEKDLESREAARLDRGDLTADEMAIYPHCQRSGRPRQSSDEGSAKISLCSQAPYRVIDLGCGHGELSLQILERFTAAHVLAFDADLRRVAKARRRMWRSLPRRSRGDRSPSRVHVAHANLAYPELRDADLCPDALILCEVIEHLEIEDRRRLLYLIARVLCPRLLILTTPNIAYNARWGIPDGEYRHVDHRVEYTRESLQDEVMSPLSAHYDIELRDLLAGEDAQPSFVLVARRKPHAPDSHGSSRINRLYAPFHLDATNYDVSAQELRLGATSHTFLRNARNVFYLGPTIAPVDHDPRHPDYLEHPAACFAYYRDRGVSDLVGENKYMGSRAYLLVLRDPDMADRIGVSNAIIVNARGGLPFFPRADRLLPLAQIYRDLQPRLEELKIDVLLLDAEILPWTLKAERMIERFFLAPGETALLARHRSGSRWTESASQPQAFLDALAQFSAGGPLEVRPFHVLARANLSSRGGATRNLRLGSHVSHDEQLSLIEHLAGGVIKPCEWHGVDLSSSGSMDRSIDRWLAYCASGGEGVVYKPRERGSLRGPDGYLRQPALKVRGRDYLRLIYGIDYLDPSWFSRLCARDTRRKRVLAVQEQELAEKLLLAFLHQNEPARLSYLAAFLGVDSVRMPEIDRTL